MTQPTQHHFVTKASDASPAEVTVVNNVEKAEDAQKHIVDLTGVKILGHKDTYADAKRAAKEANAARPPQTPGDPRPGEAPAAGVVPQPPPGGTPKP